MDIASVFYIITILSFTEAKKQTINILTIGRIDTEDNQIS